MKGVFLANLRFPLQISCKKCSPYAYQDFGVGIWIMVVVRFHNLLSVLVFGCVGYDPIKLGVSIAASL